MKKASYIFLALAVSLMACGNSNTGESDNTGSIPEIETTSSQEVNYLIGPQDFNQKIHEGEVVILDVRTPRETAQGIIEGASIVNFSDPDFQQRLGDFDKDVTYLVYCASGGRSKATQKMMNDMGFKDVFDLRGGMVAWQQEGLPVVKE